MNFDKLKSYFEEQLKRSPEVVYFLIGTDQYLCEDGTYSDSVDMRSCKVEELESLLIYLKDHPYAYSVGATPKFSKYPGNVPGGIINILV